VAEIGLRQASVNDSLVAALLWRRGGRDIMMMMGQHGALKAHLRGNMTVAMESISSEVKLVGVSKEDIRTSDESKTEVHMPSLGHHKQVENKNTKPCLLVGCYSHFSSLPLLLSLLNCNLRLLMKILSVLRNFEVGRDSNYF
jgi:hypothetical protein